jgi:ADP-L-glycero-D-manno-heptose 6-epimerase|tara:strand:+ start:1499 stop:2356 length:858 start_codon:yes stop_codon:yes gene_type:complete
MSFLVTGAAGFIGSNIVKKFGSNCICCDLPESGMKTIKESLGLISSSAFDAVFHLGAISSTTETNISLITNNNLQASCDLLEKCIDQEVPFVYASSASVYGVGKNGFKEDCISTPLNYYAISKSSFDQFVIQKIKDNPEAKIFGLRYFNVYGNGEDNKGPMASPVHKFLNQANNNKEICVFKGSEFFKRDFIHVDDIVSITLAAPYFEESGIYNVGTGKARSFLDVATAISNLTGAVIKEIPFPDHLIGKYQEFTESDNAKIDSTGYRSKRISLEEGILRVINGS